MQKTFSYDYFYLYFCAIIQNTYSIIYKIWYIKRLLLRVSM